MKPPLITVFVHKTMKNSRSDCFLLFSGCSAAGKYQFDDMLPVIHAEFTSTKLAIDTMYAPMYATTAMPMGCG